MERNAHRLFPSELVDSNPDDLDYPCKNNPYVLPIMTAHMSRQSSVLKNWKEGFFVLTQAGWLHVFATDDVSQDPLPERSIHLSTAILGPHTEPGQKQHVFSIDGKGMGGLLHRDAQTFTYVLKIWTLCPQWEFSLVTDQILIYPINICSVRANSREEMISWWSEISELTHSTTFTKHGNGGLDGGIPSRIGTISQSTSNVRPGGGNRAKSPEPYQQGALPPYDDPGKTEYTAPDRTEYHPDKTEYNDPKSQPLELSRHNTRSTVSLNMADYSEPPEAGTSKVKRNRRLARMS